MKRAGPEMRGYPRSAIPMLRFVLGHVSSTLALALTSLVWAARPVRTHPGDVLRSLLILCVLPTACAWGAASLVNTWRPRRLFDTRARRSGTLILLGAESGLLAIVITAGLLVLFEQLHMDLLLFALMAAVSACLLLCSCRRVRPGACVACGYDIRASLDYGRCPECGTSISVGLTRQNPPRERVGSGRAVTCRAPVVADT
jgi:hypothetical protein